MFKPDFSPVPRPNRLGSYLKRQWPVLIAVTLTGLLFNGSMSLIAILQGRLIDSVVSGAVLVDIAKQAAIFVSVVLAIQLMRGLKRYFVRLFANRTGVCMRKMLYNSLMARDITAFSGVSAGDVMNRAVGDVDLCVEGMRKVLTEIFDTGVLMLCYLITMLGYDVKTTLAACIFVPVAMLVAEKMKKVVERCTKAARAQSSAVSQLTLSNAENALLYRVNSVTGLRETEYDKELARLESRALRAGVVQNSMQPVYRAISLIGIFAVIVLGGRNAVQGLWTVGDFTAYVSIFLVLARKASSAAKLFNTYQMASVSWSRIKPSFEEYSAPEKSEPLPEGQAGLICQKLGFGYYGAESAVFQNLSFEAGCGELIGVTGKVACGKTALGLALTGLYPYSGSARLWGGELSALSPSSRSAAISYMGHDPQLFSDTIRENISLGDDGDISQVLNAVCFSEDLAAMPEGINTRVGAGGVRLSGGQRARIALARALYRDSRLLILDDPFSAVDMETEQKIIENLSKMNKNRIILLISHRLAIFPQTDRVLFFHEDEIISSTHEKLLAENAAYAGLWDSQRGGSHEI